MVLRKSWVKHLQNRNVWHQRRTNQRAGKKMKENQGTKRRETEAESVKTNLNMGVFRVKQLQRRNRIPPFM